MLTQNYLKKQIRQLPNIRVLLGRSRLRFTIDEITFYVYMLAQHQHRRVEFKHLYVEFNYQYSYANFMKNISLCSKLLPLLFVYHTKALNIKPSPLLTIVDSTLIPTVQSQNITKKHWQRSMVTTRSTISSTGVRTKRHISGFKLFVFMDRKGRINKAHVSHINSPDNLITKEPLYHQLSGVVLADRGFNSKEIRKRSASIYRLISPPNYKEKHTLTKQEQRLYKLRWKVETAFQQLKNEYKEFKLQISNRYSKAIQYGDVFLALMKYNAFKQQ